MKISLGMDHAGLALRPAVETYLKNHNIEIIDHGTHTPDSVDYPDFAQLVGQDVATGNADFGILMCSSGIGMSISANKVKGVRAALVQNEDNAEFSRRHNDANVICMGQKYLDLPSAQKLLDIFLKTPFDGGRHERRVNKVKAEDAAR